jgi:hypothetical protein
MPSSNGNQPLARLEWTYTPLTIKTPSRTMRQSVSLDGVGATDPDSRLDKGRCELAELKTGHVEEILTPCKTPGHGRAQRSICRISEEEN